jgi:hypothetical protein
MCFGDTLSPTHLLTNVPSNFYDVCAEEISCEQGNSHKCVASCRLSFILANNDFCKYLCISHKNFIFFLLYFYKFMSNKMLYFHLLSTYGCEICTIHPEAVFL